MAALLLLLAGPLLAAQQTDSEALRQQLEELNRDNAALDAQNEELRRRVAELEKQTRELTPQAMQPLAPPSEERGNPYYWLVAILAGILAAALGWKWISRGKGM